MYNWQQYSIHYHYTNEFNTVFHCKDGHKQEGFTRHNLVKYYVHDHDDIAVGSRIHL